MKTMFHRIPAVISLVILAVLTGCGRDQNHLRSPVYPVEGQLLVSGMPAANAKIAFHPVHHQEGRSICPVAITGPDGTFRLTTYSAHDGAPAGEYYVTVIWPNESIPVDECAELTPAHDRLHLFYANPETRRIPVMVLPQSNQIPIHITVGSSGWSLPRSSEKTQPE